VSKTRISFCLIFICFVIAATTPIARAQGTTTDFLIIHLLNRISFGPAPGDLESVRASGIDAYIEKQLNPQKLPTSRELEERLKNLPTLNAPMDELAETYGLPKNEKDLPEDERKAIRKKQNIVVEELAEAKILRAVMSPAQLQEVMTDFWFNHFNVFAEKGPDKLMISSYERDAIRPFALGKFGDLLKATAHHPAMLFYLDNWLNTDPNSKFTRGKKIGINENYAREIMELHTLGINGGYTQEDVTTLAHILTGWGLSEGREQSQRTSFYFEARRHDYENKTWLNTKIEGGADAEIEEVLGILAHHPATAHHIAYEIVQYFVADEPPKGLVDKLTATFKSSDGDIAQMLRVLFHAPEFWDAKDANQKFKPPFRFVVSALRASGAVPEGDTRMLQGAIAQMGEPLYRCLTPNGYANTNDQWLNSDALLKRIDFSKKLSTFLDNDSAGVLYRTFGQSWSSATQSAVHNAAPKLQAALLLSSPEFVYY